MARPCSLALFFLLIIARAGPGGSVRAGGADRDVGALLDKMDIRGGLWLLLGGEDPSLAQALVAKSTLYVQVLEPDAKKAEQWGSLLAGAGYRQQIGMRAATFDVDHYGTNLFNLIVVRKGPLPNRTRLTVRIETNLATTSSRARHPS